MIAEVVIGVTVTVVLSAIGVSALWPRREPEPEPRCLCEDGLQPGPMGICLDCKERGRR